MLISIHALREEGDDPDPAVPCRQEYFYPRPPRGGRRIIFAFLARAFPFLSTPSARRATTAHRPRWALPPYFYPRPPRGGRQIHVDFSFLVFKFLSTPSARRATVYSGRPDALHRHFYPRPPRGGRRSVELVVADSWTFLSTPSARRATITAKSSALPCAFLSTPSARRATQPKTDKWQRWQHFYPRPPRGGRLERLEDSPTDKEISIHALREEGDSRRHPAPSAASYFYPRPPRGGRRENPKNCLIFSEFLSTPSARRATRVSGCYFWCGHISIHALREEGDAATLCSCKNPVHFYPRPPRGGRPMVGKFSTSMVEFLSTPSARRATSTSHSFALRTSISIHALREEGDAAGTDHLPPQNNFYPRPPRGGRPGGMPSPRAVKEFLSTPSARRATAKAEKNLLLLFYYISFCTN